MAGIEDIILSSNRNPSGCFLCEHPNATHHLVHERDGVEYHCPICGTYTVLRRFYITIFHDEYQTEFFAKAPAVAALRQLEGRDNYILSFKQTGNSIIATIGDNDFLEEYPADFLQKLDKVLWNIGKLTQFDPSHMCGFNESNMQYLFCNDITEAKTLIQFLIDEGYVTAANWSSQNVFAYANLRLSLSGLKKVLHLKQVENSSLGFVAMWYDSHTDQYKEAVKQAIHKAGYKMLAGCVRFGRIPLVWSFRHWRAS